MVEKKNVYDCSLTRVSGTDCFIPKIKHIIRIVMKKKTPANILILTVKRQNVKLDIFCGNF